MISLPNTIVEEAKSLQTGLERGQFNTNALLSFLTKVVAAGKPKPKAKKTAFDAALEANILDGLMTGRTKKFRYREHH